MLSRNIERFRSYNRGFRKKESDKYQRAYENRDVQLCIEAHLDILKNPQSHLESHRGTSGGTLFQRFVSAGYLKSFVYGGMDGMITTYSVVMGCLGANLKIGVVVVLGFANMVGDGFSMGLGDYLSTKAELEFREIEKKREEWEIENDPEGETLEVKEIYIERGLSEDDADLMSRLISKSKKAWLEIMLIAELGFVECDENPFGNALVTFVSFEIFAIMPLLPFIIAKGSDSTIDTEKLFIISSVLTALFLFILGLLKTIFTSVKWYRSGMEQLFLGALVSFVSWFIGYLLEPLAK